MSTMDAALDYWNLMVRTPFHEQRRGGPDRTFPCHLGLRLRWLLVDLGKLGSPTRKELQETDPYPIQADNQANVYGGTRTNVSTDKAVKYYTSHGATASKINMGIPLYGRAVEDTTGIGASYNGVRLASLNIPRSGTY